VRTAYLGRRQQFDVLARQSQVVKAFSIPHDPLQAITLVIDDENAELLSCRHVVLLEIFERPGFAGAVVTLWTGFTTRTA
jgi:hypothetical protein